MRNRIALLMTFLSVAALLTALARPSLAAQSAGSEPAQSQPQAEPPAPAPQDLDNQKLNLSPEQKSQIKQVRENVRSQVQAIRQDSSLTPEQKEDRIRQIRRDTHKQVMGVLTPEQRKIWKVRQHERRKHRREHRRQHRRRPL